MAGSGREVHSRQRVLHGVGTLSRRGARRPGTPRGSPSPALGVCPSLGHPSCVWGSQQSCQVEGQGPLRSGGSCGITEPGMWPSNPSPGDSAHRGAQRSSGREAPGSREPHDHRHGTRRATPRACQGRGRCLYHLSQPPARRHGPQGTDQKTGREGRSGRAAELGRAGPGVARQPDSTC